jgi:hypothetical protein
MSGMTPSLAGGFDAEGKYPSDLASTTAAKGKGKATSTRSSTSAVPPLPLVAPRDRLPACDSDRLR